MLDIDEKKRSLMITGENLKKVEKYFGKVETLTDDDCEEIIEMLDEERLERYTVITTAFWSTEDEIVYWIE